jgi:transposase
LQGNNLIKDMTYQYFCGWDISKLTLNYCLHDLQGRVVQEGQIKNSIVILVITGLFERIPSAGKCASYAGISPHERQSGTTLRQRFRASRSASRSLKTAFHQGAMSLIQGDNLFNQLYRRLRAKGRSHKQAINAVRNKIIKVLYACLGKDTMYCKKYHQNLQGL